jgi:hypothetical protein
MQSLSRRHHVGWESKRALKQSLRSKKSPQKADTIAIAGADMPESSEHHTIVWEEPGRLSRLFSNITWFCPRNRSSLCHSVSDTSDEHSESSDEGPPPPRVLLTTIDHVVPVIRQPPPVQVQTTCSEPSESAPPTIVYIYNLPKNQPSVIQLSDRLTSIDTLTVSDGDDDDDSSDNGMPPPAPIYRNAPPRPPLHANNNSVARPTLMASRTLTFGSCTTQSSRHRRLRQTVSDLKLNNQEKNDDDDDTLFSEASPFPQLPDDLLEEDSNEVVAISPKEQQPRGRRLSPPPPPPPLIQSSEATLDDEETWMHDWVNGGTSIPVQESRDDDGGEIHVPFHSVESTYLPKCSWLEQGYSSAGSKIMFAGWLVYIPAGKTCVEELPSRRDVVYLMMFRDLPKIFLARDDINMTMTIDVSPTTRAFLVCVSKRHGQGVMLMNNGVHVGTLLPISLASYMFDNHSLVGEEEFQQLAHTTIAPFRKYQHRSNTLDWNDVEHHQEYAPTAQLEAAMHLFFVMDSWMTKMLVR